MKKYIDLKGVALVGSFFALVGFSESLADILITFVKGVIL